MIWVCLALCAVAAVCLAAAQLLIPSWWSVVLVLVGLGAFAVAVDLKPPIGRRDRR